MHESELQVGDIIFWMDTSNVPEHVAIYNGYKDGVHFVTHATSAPYHSVMTTRLKPSDIPYHVFRSTNFSLAAQATLRMRIWAEHQVPFTQEKAAIYDAILDLPKMSHPTTGGEAQYHFANKYFSRNFYRYIEMAAHAERPFFPEESDERKIGIRCTEAIVSALNIETLLQIDAVKRCAELKTSWISDQTNTDLQHFIDLLPSEFKPSSTYWSYREQVSSEWEYDDLIPISSNTYKVPGNFPPSFMAWQYEKYGSIEHFVKCFDFPLPLDAKITTPWAMITCLQQRSTHWQDLGKLTLIPTAFTKEKLEADKMKWREYVDQVLGKAEENNTRILTSSQSAAAASLPISPVRHAIKRKMSVDATDELPLPDIIASQHQHTRALIFATPKKKNSLCQYRDDSPELLEKLSISDKPRSERFRAFNFGL